MEKNISYSIEGFRAFFYIISIISWLLLLITSVMGFLNLVIINYESYFESENNNKNANIYISFNNVWSFINYNEKNNENSENYYLPIQGKPGLYYTLFLLYPFRFLQAAFFIYIKQIVQRMTLFIK